MEKNSIKMSESHEILKAIVLPLCSWYLQNKRKLPWRKNQDPYRIWVSEIMLQQTRVEAAIPYYERFLKELPSVFDLASADEEKVLKLWEGLGYYSRVKNMQKAAKILVNDYDGEFPRDAKKLRALPGIGDYTAGAIASIAFSLPEPAVDGNVLRVLSRILEDERDIMLPDTKKSMHAGLKEVYPLAENAGDFTQALMELGALICIPGGAPRCEACPLSALCLARKKGKEQVLPVKAEKKEKKTVLKTVFIIKCKDKVALLKRPETGLLANFYEFPSFEGHLTKKEAETVLADLNLSGEVRAFIKSRHVFTHLIWEMKSFSVSVAEENEAFTWASREELMQTFPLPSAMKPFYEKLFPSIET